MIHGPEGRLRHADGAEPASWPGGPARQTDIPGDRTADGGARPPRTAEALLRGLVAPFYACMQGVMAVAAAVSFQRMVIVHRERFPMRGPAVLIANHPAAWTDVVVLDVAFGRKLHFLAQEALFRPWLRGALLRLYGTLPVGIHREGGDGLNRRTFAACRALLARGEVVAVFPEGVSDDDRALLPLKTGAARLLLARGDGDAAPAVPVAIHYEDRLAFRGRVTLAVGEPLRAAAYRAEARSDPDGTARAFTADMADALQRTMADAAIHATRKRAPRGRGTAFEALVRVLGGLGRIAHAPVVALIEAAARRFMGRPQRLAFGRIAFGLVLVPLWYATLVALAFAWGAGAGLVLAPVLPALGVFACFDADRRRARGGPGETSA